MYKTFTFYKELTATGMSAIAAIHDLAYDFLRLDANFISMAGLYEAFRIGRIVFTNTYRRGIVTSIGTGAYTDTLESTVGFCYDASNDSNPLGSLEASNNFRVHNRLEPGGTAFISFTC